MKTSITALRVGVIGPAGFGGSYLCVELINRGHHVVGLSRHPERLGSHASYEPRPIDIEGQSDKEIAIALGDIDVLVSEYGPHTAGHQALQYMPFIEAIRKIVLAVKRAKVKYFIMVGGTGSLLVPGTDGQCVADCSDFFLPYRRGISDSHAHVTYMEERLGPIGASLRLYRNARLELRTGSEKEKEAAKAVIDAYEGELRRGDVSGEFIKAARASALFFHGNTSFDWTYVSPSALYRPGKRTGVYEIGFDELPLRGPLQGENQMDGRLMGISVADLAVAIADEVEGQKLKHKHWTATGDLSDDSPAPSYLTLGEGATALV